MSVISCQSAVNLLGPLQQDFSSFQDPSFQVCIDHFLLMLDWSKLTSSHNVHAQARHWQKVWTSTGFALYSTQTVLLKGYTKSCQQWTPHWHIYNYNLFDTVQFQKSAKMEINRVNFINKYNITMILYYYQRRERKTTITWQWKRSKERNKTVTIF